MLSNCGRRLFKELHNLVMVLHAVEPAADAARHAADHGAQEVVFLERRKILHLQQLNRLQAHFFGRLAKVVQRDLVVAPSADRLMDAAFEFVTCGGVRRLQAA